MPYKRQRTVEEGAHLVTKLIKKRVDRDECCRQLNVGRFQFYNYVRKAREMGLLPDAEPRIDTAISDIPRGNLRREVSYLDKKIQKWLLDSVPEGSSLAEFAIACVVDQYFDEVGE
jgi:hypothetical protein